MQVDPSMIKQLLQLQLLQSLDTVQDTQAGFGSSAGAGGDFAQLLETLLAGSGSETAPAGGKVIPASELLARTASPAAFGRSMLDRASPAPARMSAPADYDAYIESAGRRHGVDASLVKAVIQAESDFDASAVSRAGAKGLMQLMDSTGQGLGVRDPFDPRQNIEGGTRFLSNLLQKYNGNEGVALAAYNAGPGRVDRLGIRTDADLQDKLRLLPKETQKYVSRVLGFKEHYQA